MSANTSSSRGKGHQPSASSGGLKPLLLVQQHVAGPSHINLFLTSLKLLDLDLRDDWPDITAATFSTKDAQQNQKKRIQCVEWALFRLFEIWDPDETRYKLQPFFPPLEPLQSLNLRAALFRCLEQAKKVGVLGRDTVLRKTMLDECKGERLDEVLSVFSVVVLKKRVQQGEAPTSIAHQLAMESFSYNGERTTLSTLILAHKSSLTRTLAVKNEVAAGYDDFADLLNLKERQVIRRYEQMKVAIEEDDQVVNLSEGEAIDLQSRVQSNWTGSDEWLEIVLRGDSRFKKDGVLQSSFRRVWGHVEIGSLGEIEDQDRKGLLEQLDARVREQKHRLTKWQEFEKSLKFNGKTKTQALKSQANQNEKGIDLGFESHQSLQISQGSSKVTPEKGWEPLEEYARLMESMQEALAAVGKPIEYDPRPKRWPEVGRKRPGSVEGEVGTPREQIRHDLDQSSPSESESDDPSPSFEKYATKSTSQTPPSAHAEEPKQPEVLAITLPPMVTKKAAPKPIQQLLTPANSNVQRPPSPPRQDDSPAASDILASVLATSPSPTKPRHVLSLAERTRLSMSRSNSKSHVNLSDSDDLPELNNLSHKLRRVSRQPTALNEPVLEATSHHADLAARTRQSMSGMEAVEKKARLERRRSIKAAERNKRDARASYFPKHLEPTVEDDDILDDGIDKKKLIEGEAEADYESVFKARPKIKTSPVLSPVKAWGDMGGQGTFDSSSPTVAHY